MAKVLWYGCEFVEGTMKLHFIFFMYQNNLRVKNSKVPKK